MPSSSAAVATTTLNVDPGGYRPCSARSSSGWSLSVVREAHSAWSMPEANVFGSYSGRLVSESTSPVFGLRITAAPLYPVSWKPSSTAFCSVSSMVSLMRRPSTGGISSSVRISRPMLLTTTRRAPSSPISRLL